MKNKSKIRDLKNKKRELERIDKLYTTSEIILPAQIKEIKKKNKTPKGLANIKNHAGNIIDLNGVSKTYVVSKNIYHALNNVDFSIKKGEFVVILGPSGSGKTTLLNIISGLDRATDGKIIVNDINISALNNRELTTFRRNNVGFVFQSYNLLNELNAYDNAALGQSLQIDGNKRLDLDELFERVGMSSKSKRPLNELSGGQLQRVSIVRALAKNPAIIFADEPTGALDSKTASNVIDLFLEINKRYGTTIIFVTHDEKIAKLADKIIKVKDGEVQIEIN